jgi:hypothetical protein
VHVLHAAREGELDVAGDRDLAAQAQLADEAAEVVLGVGAQEVAAGAAGEGVEEEEVGAGAEGDGLDAGAGEGRSRWRRSSSGASSPAEGLPSPR